MLYNTIGGAVRTLSRMSSQQAFDASCARCIHCATCLVMGWWRRWRRESMYAKAGGRRLAAQDEVDLGMTEKLLRAGDVERALQLRRANAADRFQEILLDDVLRDIRNLPPATPSPGEVERLRGDWKFINSAVDHWSEGIAEAEEAMEIIRDRVLKRRAVLHPQEKPE